MKQITRLNPALCPRTIAAILELLSDGREIAVFKGLAYVATVGGEVWHVALMGDLQPYANDWTDENFGFPPAKKHPRRSVKTLAAFAPATRAETPSQPHTIPTQDNPHAFEISRLQAAIAGDFRTLPIAYPILARHGFMERTANGFHAIDPETVRNRCRALIAQWETA